MKGMLLAGLAVVSGLSIANELLPGPAAASITRLDLDDPACSILAPNGSSLVVTGSPVTSTTLLPASSTLSLACVPPGAVRFRIAP